MQRWDLPAIEAADPDPTDRGHCWIEEWLTGTVLRARLDDAGALAFAEIDAASPPAHLEGAVETLRETLDRAALREAVADPTGVVLVVLATHDRGLDYPWERLDPAIGVAVYDPDGERWLPPGAAHRVLEGVGLETLPVVARERPARDLDASIATPESAVRSGPAAAVLVRNKRGDRALVGDPTGETRPSIEGEPATVAATLLTEERLERALAAVGPDAIDRVRDRVFAAAAREEWSRLERVDLGAVRSALGERVATAIAERE